jgi:DNA-directed RNA polymerase subunit alpha
LEETHTLELPAFREILIQAGSGDLTQDTFHALSVAAYEDEKSVEEMRRILSGWEAFAKTFVSKETASILLGFCQLLSGDLEASEESLKPVRRTPWGGYYYARVLDDRKRLTDAIKAAEEAVEKNPDCLLLTYRLVELECKAADLDVAGKTLDKLKKQEEGTAEWLYHKGFWCERDGQYAEAIRLYREAVVRDAEYSEALFRLGYLLELYGTESDEANEESLATYECCVQVKPVHSNAVVNLGLLYEDRERYHDAIKCYETVLRRFPNDTRAKMYLGDAHAATSMFYDKEQEKKADKQSQVLRIPVSDFELSVRSRNCLQKMNILTLGDLILKTEQELLSYKNFGETSLMEIKEMLSQKGLHLGQGLDIKTGEASAGRNPLEATASPEVLAKPIEELNLSVRSRRCMERLEVRSLRDLINKTEVELMSAKNFGMTSLNEIKRKLVEAGLSLKP